MTSPWDIPKASPFLSTKEDRRNFGRNNGARGGSIPQFVKPKIDKPKAQTPNRAKMSKS